MEVVRANGIQIAYERVGDGRALVLVHGAGVDGRMWQPQISALADEFTVVARDEPGAGRSDDLPADFGLADTHTASRRLSMRSSWAQRRRSASGS